MAPIGSDVETLTGFLIKTNKLFIWWKKCEEKFTEILEIFNGIFEENLFVFDCKWVNWWRKEFTSDGNDQMKTLRC